MNAVRRFEHGSRVPGWDRAVDLDKDPATIPDADTTDVPAELRAEIEAHMANYPDRRSAALPALAAAQRVHHWCSPEAIEQVACVMRLTPAYLESVASFYDMLETTPVGRHSVYVCTNISCSLCGADELYEAVREAAVDGIDGEPINVRSFECLGACDIAPMASIDGVYVGPLTPATPPLRSRPSTPPTRTWTPPGRPSGPRWTRIAQGPPQRLKREAHEHGRPCRDPDPAVHRHRRARAAHARRIRTARRL
jgi:NADH:ubiquinone oxidoreductase subunit E